MLTRTIVVIILQYIHVSTNYAVHMKLICHMLIISHFSKDLIKLCSTEKKEKKNEEEERKICTGALILILGAYEQY